MKKILLAYFLAAVLFSLIGTNKAVSENSNFTFDDRIRCINESQWSTQQCWESAVIAFKDEISVRSNCSQSGGFLTFEQAFCNESEINALNKLLCDDNVTLSDCFSWKLIMETTTMTVAEKATYSNSTTTVPIHVSNLTESQYFENLKTVLNYSTLSSTCQESVLNETQNTNSSWCLNNNATDSLNCSKAESVQIFKRICSAKTTITPTVSRAPTVAITTTTKMPLRMLINDTLREKILSFVDHNISSTCRWSVGRRIPRQLTDTRRICKMFRQSGQNLIANRICTTDEVIKLTAIFCELNFRAGLVKIAATEEGRRDQALDIMANDITTKCHNMMWPQVQIFQGSLAKGCELLVKASPILLSLGTCIQSDIDKLRPIVCYVEPKDPKIVQFQEKLIQFLGSLDNECNSTMLPTMKNATNETEACHVWSKVLDDHRNNETVCSDKDNNLFTTSFCSRLESSPNSVSYTHISKILFFILTIVPHFYKLST